MADGSAVRPWAAGRRAASAWTVTVVEPDAALDRRAVLRRGSTTPALVAACLAGRREAFDVIVARHRRAVYQVCYRFIGNHEDASDLAQDAFVRAWRGLGSFKGQAALSTWLYRIAVNACLNRVPRQSPRPSRSSRDRFVDTRADDPRAGLLRDERAAAVRQAIARLPEKQRATLILRAYHELPHQEIAASSAARSARSRRTSFTRWRT